MNKAIYIEDIEVIDPDSGGIVTITIFKDQASGGMFGVDASYLDTQEINSVTEPINNATVELIY